ncbi:MAG TPA: (4Fe-4S)-binding protein [Cryomorphaceae bacterium]|nr:(4Fe-4S)-binding protein [Cryomorphaceae bacterium]
MIKKEYQNGDTTVVWKPELCYHSKNCVRNLPKVFDPNRKPWIVAENASEEELRAAIDKCPSGALSYKFKGEEPNNDTMASTIEPLKNGPVLVKGKLRLKSLDGERDLEQEVIALCRCGASSKKPYCDGSHTKIDFQAD